MNYFIFFLALLPIIVFIFFLFFRKTSLLVASLWTLVTTSVLALVVWRIHFPVLFYSTARGSLVAFDIAIIIIGAIFFLDVLKNLHTVEKVARYLTFFSKDYRIQVLMLAWFFEAFLEGTAGFGTATAIVAPLLIGIGISPLRAVILALIGNSAPVVFGAVGAPIRVGFADFDTSAMPLLASAINLVGIVIPVFMAWFSVSGEKDRMTAFKEILPFSIFSGISFGVCSFLASFLGGEFPSVIGSIGGIVLSGIALHFGLFAPRHERVLKKQDEAGSSRISFFKTFFPYFILIAFLILGKILLGNISFVVPFGINHKMSLFNPGLAFLLGGVLIALFLNNRWKNISTSFFDSLKRAWEPFMVIALISIAVKIMTSSSLNYSGLASFMEIMSKPLETSFLPLIAPFVGMFGCFLTGSATVSNIMFGQFLYSAAGTVGINGTIVLVLSLVGASIGNMIALADILATEAVVDLKNKEREVVFAVLLPCLLCVGLVALVGFFIF